jgi:hypothetical protein
LKFLVKIPNIFPFPSKKVVNIYLAFSTLISVFLRFFII